MRVLPPSPSRRSSRTALLAVLVSSGLLVAGCGGGDASAGASASASTSPSASQPTTDVEVPDGVELTAAGTGLDLGQDAVVPYEPGGAGSDGSVLSLRVASVRTGTVKDLAAYQLDARTRRSTPYYVRWSAENVGTGDVGGAPVPLYAVDSDDSLVQPSSFTSSFTTCPSTPLPKKFGQGRKTSGCLVYLLPDRGKLTGVSFRPVQQVAPITWTGEVQPVAKKKG